MAERLGKLMRLPMSLRIFAVAAVLAAPLLPPAHRAGRGRAVVFAVDRSESVGAAGRDAAELFVRQAVPHRGDARVGIVAFDGAAELLLPVDDLFGGDDPSLPSIARQRRPAPTSPPPSGSPSRPCPARASGASC